LDKGVIEMKVPQPRTLADRVGELRQTGLEKQSFDYGGGFMQVSGMKYAFDLSKPEGQRISGLFVKGPQGYAEMKPDQTYSVVTRVHAIDKWHGYGIFGDVPLEQAYQNLRATPVDVSPVDMLGEHIRGKTLNPNKFAAVEGRITNLTPAERELPIRLGSYSFAQGVDAVQDPVQNR
jgi:hypothetical protein